jgi:hypothetical protein
MGWQYIYAPSGYLGACLENGAMNSYLLQVAESEAFGSYNDLLYNLLYQGVSFSNETGVLVFKYRSMPTGAFSADKSVTLTACGIIDPGAGGNTGDQGVFVAIPVQDILVPAVLVIMFALGAVMGSRLL